MKGSKDRIRTSHVGALPPTDDWHDKAASLANADAAALAPYALAMVKIGRAHV